MTDNKKKRYESPKMATIEMNTGHQLLAGSGGSDGSSDPFSKEYI